MAVSNIFRRDVSAGKSPRNAFPVSYSTLFSSPAGLLLPCYVEEVDKGDKLKIDVSNITRTKPFNTSAFMTFDEKVDFWFVPFHLLWSDWTNWRIGQSYRHRSTELFNAGKQYLLPHCKYSDVSDFLASFKSPIIGNTFFFQPNIPDTLRFLDLLGYSVPRGCSLSELVTSSVVGTSEQMKPVLRYYNLLSTQLPFNYFRLLAYQCIYMHGYRNEEYEQLDPSYYNVDNLFEDLVPNNVESDISSVSSNSRLAPSQPVALTPLDDRLTCAKLFQPRYKNWRQDLFTSLKPTSGFEVGVTGLEFNQRGTGSDFAWPTGQIDRASNSGYGGRDSFFDPTSSYPSTSTNAATDPKTLSTAFSFISSNPAAVYQSLAVSTATSTGYGQAILWPQNIRNLMSQDKFVRASIYARKNISDQMKALFGDNYEDPHTPRYLGSYSSNLQIQDVTASSAGTNDGGPLNNPNGSNVLGEVAGKGLNQSGKNGVVNYTFDCDGVVMGIHYIIPRNNYDSFRVSRMNTKVSRWDYFYPQFDGLGMQPVFQFERSIPQVPSSDTASFPVTTLLGFAPRFFEYKQRTNEIHGPFMSGESESYWTLSNNSTSVTSASNPQNFKVLPTITDRIFGVSYDGSWGSDPFYHYYYFNVTRVSNKEIYGTPSI